MERYRDRREAGQVLAAWLKHYAGRPDLQILGLPRGGVPVAAEIARELGAPLDVLLVRKLGVPGQEELAMGAIASGGFRVLNPEVASYLPPHVIEAVTREEQRELERREALYRGGRPPPDLRGRCVVLVDDGLATGSTMRVAIAAVRSQDPARIVVAVPVAAADTLARLRSEADEVVCPLVPDAFHAVSPWYWDFSPVSDAEVRALLDASAGVSP